MVDKIAAGLGGRSDSRRDEIVHAARTLFEERGIARTSVKDITSSIKVTRGLFYYYFADKNAVIMAVIDEYAAECATEVHAWNETRPKNDATEALRSMIGLLRHLFVDADAFGRNLDLAENAEFYWTFVDRSVSEVASSIIDTIGGDGKVRHVSHPDESLYMLIFGLVGLLKKNPDIDDRALMAILRDILIAS